MEGVEGWGTGLQGRVREENTDEDGQDEEESGWQGWACIEPNRNVEQGCNGREESKEDFDAPEVGAGCPGSAERCLSECGSEVQKQKRYELVNEVQARLWILSSGCGGNTHTDARMVHTDVVLSR